MRVPGVSLFIALVLLVLGLLGASPALNAKISAEEQRKRDLFLKARESIEPLPPAAKAKPAVPPQPRPRPTPPPMEKMAKPIKLPPPKKAPERAQPKETPKPRPSGKVRPLKSEPSPRDSRREMKLPPVKPASTPTPNARQGVSAPKRSGGSKKAPAAPIVIEKSGLEEERGLAPAPSKEKGGFFGLFGGPRYRYLTRGVRAAIDRAPVKRGRWKYIVVHNSATRQGNAKIFGNYHKNVRKMKNGLACHFVIGNGTSSGDGEIEVGSRWTRQINGGHVASDYLNNISLGICFVGDFDRDKPTKAQLASLEELIKYLRKRAGRSKGKIVVVKAHHEINPRPTSCPGKRFPYRWFHRTFD